jgi:transposase
VRNGWQEERTALLNRTRGLLAEFGVVIARSADRFFSALPILIEDARLPDPVHAMLLEVREQLAASKPAACPLRPADRHSRQKQ